MGSRSFKDENSASSIARSNGWESISDLVEIRALEQCQPRRAVIKTEVDDRELEVHDDERGRQISGSLNAENLASLLAWNLFCFIFQG